jgi:excinuclease UvrABC ATPase subunit
MGITLGLKEGRSFVTCDTCGEEITGEVHVDPANDVRDYERLSHANPEECGKKGEADAVAGFNNHFGRCPVCGGSGLCLNVGRDHWFVCSTHRVRWHVGSNLFSAWRHEDEETWRRNEAELLGYRDVTRDA